MCLVSSSGKRIAPERWRSWVRFPPKHQFFISNYMSTITLHYISPTHMVIRCLDCRNRQVTTIKYRDAGLFSFRSSSQSLRLANKNLDSFTSPLPFESCARNEKNSKLKNWDFHWLNNIKWITKTTSKYSYQITCHYSLFCACLTIIL